MRLGAPLGAVLFFALCSLLTARPLRAEPASAACISPAATKALSSCPVGTRRATGRRQPVFRSPPPPRAQPNARHSPPPPRDFPPDPRKASPLTKRRESLLVAEAHKLSRLLAQTPRKDPSRPTLIRRLADDFVELETTSRNAQLALEILEHDQRTKKRSSAASRARSDAAKARDVMLTARKGAIRLLELYRRDYPNAPHVDEILYQLAFEHEQAEDAEAARKVYLELIQQAPQSAYVPNAYLAFGELFFREAQGDPAKWELAAQAYREVARYPAPANKVQGYARYKLAYVFWNRGEHAAAMSELKKVVELAERQPGLPGAQALALAARRDLVPLYAAAGAPERAFGFFSVVSGDRGGASARTLALLSELGVAYLDTGHYREALTLYKDLLGRDPGERSCGYQARIVEATVGLRSADKDAIFRELERQLALRGEFERGGFPAAARLACGNRTAELLSETAMAWHLEAVGSGGVRGTGDPRTMALAEKLYLAVAKSFDKKDFARFEFPRLVREDWPSAYKIRYARADLLFEQRRWNECGPAFAAVAAEDPDAADTPEALYASALCYQHSYEQAHAAGSDRQGRGLAAGEQVRQARVDWQLLKPRALSDLQRGMIEAFDRFLCVVQPPTQPGEARDRYVEVKYARARTYFEAQHWEEAALAFRDIALNHADHDSAIYAAQLGLEALNVLYAYGEPQRAGCLDELATATAQIAGKHCAKPESGAASELCRELIQVECDVGRKRAEGLTAVADASKPPELDRYLRVANAYLALWREHGARALARGGEPECRRMDEVIYNMARAFQAAHLLVKAIEARLILIDERWGMHETPLGRRALYELGQNYQAIAVYQRTAEYFERYAAAVSYQGADVDRALSDAVILRLGLGQREAALKTARSFEQKFGARPPQRAAEIAFALASDSAEKEQWDAVTTALGASLKLIDAKAPLDVRVQAHALLGRAAAKLARTAAATREYERVRELWRDPRAAASAIRQGEGDAEGRERRLGRTVTAVGEALFYFAEQGRAKADAVRFPVYRGPGTRAAVLEHLNGKVLPWIQQKRPLIEQAMAAYKAIMDLEPAPPPRWVIAASAQVGAMWAGFVREFRAAPVPDSIKKDPELLASYWRGLDSASEAQKQTAQSAYAVCLDYSSRYQYFDENSQSCENWLADNDKARHHRFDEFHGAPSRVNSVLAERSPALDVAGRPRRN